MLNLFKSLNHIIEDILTHSDNDDEFKQKCYKSWKDAPELSHIEFNEDDNLRTSFNKIYITILPTRNGSY
jgi:hypothetical protein